MRSKNFFMVNRMSKYNNENKNHIKTLLKKLNISFEILRSNTDIIYMIEYSPKEFSSNIGTIPILLIYSIEEKILVAICPNIYKIKKGDSTLNILYALNKANTKLSNGNITMNNKYITYKYQEEFDNIELVTKEKLESIFNDIVIASIYTCEEIKRMKTNNEE